MTEQDLYEAGYYRCRGPFALRVASHFYQRKVMDDDKIVYFVNVYVYRQDHGVALEAEVQLYLSGDRWLTLEAHHVEKWTVEQMEALFFEAFVKLGCVPDVHNND